MTTAAWVKVPIGDICDLVNGRAFKPSDWSETGLPIIRIQNLNRRDASYNHYAGQIEDRYKVISGDLLFAWSGTPGTSFGAHIWNGGPAVLNQHIFRVDFDRELIDVGFFKYAINETLGELIAKAHGGVGLRHVTKRTVQSTKIDLPPLAEQREIAAALGRIDERLLSIREQLKLAEVTADKLKEEVLTRAFRPGLNVLYTALSELVDDGPANGWSPKSGEDATGPLSLRLTATTSGYLRLDAAAVKRIYDRPSKDSKYWLRSGDLLVQRANALEHVGATAIFEGPQQTYIYPDLMMRLRISDAGRRKYIWRYLNSPQARQYLRSKATGTAGNMPKINGTTLRSLPVPIPKNDDFGAVADHLDRALSFVADAKAGVEESITKLDAIKSAVLRAAFSGRLVRMDVATESAMELLKRIKSRRSNRSLPVRKRRATAEFRHEEEVMEKTRALVAADHLGIIVKKLGGGAAPIELWRKSDMALDEFYKQLRAEVTKGHLIVARSKRRTVIQYAP